MTTTKEKKPRVKTVFDTSELYHVWASQGQEHGHNKGGALSFDGPWLGYRRTKIAWVDKDKGVALVNSNHYDGGGWGGRTENNHRYGAERAVSHMRVCKVPEQFLKWMSDKSYKPGGWGTDYSVRYTADDWFGWCVGRLLKNRLELDKEVGKAKAHRHGLMMYGLGRKSKDQENIVAALLALELIDVEQVRLYNGVAVALRYTEDELAAAKEYSAKWEAVDAARVRKHGAFGRKSYEQRQRERDERERARLIKLAVTDDEWGVLCKAREERVKSWKESTNPNTLSIANNWYANYNSETTGRYVVKEKGQQATPTDWRAFPLLEHQQHTILAIRDSSGTPDNHMPQVITSRGAKVPIDQAIRLLRLVERVRISGMDYVVRSEDGEKHKFGYYNLSRVSKDGEVTIGCHTITWPVIEEFRPRLMEYWLRWKDGREEVSMEVNNESKES